MSEAVNPVTYPDWQLLFERQVPVGRGVSVVEGECEGDSLEEVLQENPRQVSRLLALQVKGQTQHRDEFFLVRQEGSTITLDDLHRKTVNSTCRLTLTFCIHCHSGSVESPEMGSNTFVFESI